MCMYVYIYIYTHTYIYIFITIIANTTRNTNDKLFVCCSYCWLCLICAVSTFDVYCSRWDRDYPGLPERVRTNTVTHVTL